MQLDDSSFKRLNNSHSESRKKWNETESNFNKILLRTRFYQLHLKKKKLNFSSLEASVTK